MEGVVDMTKPKINEGYRGPWMKFSRARSEAGFPIISVSKNGIGWKRLSAKDSWNIMVLLRGPDEELSCRDKNSTTAQVRGLFLNWDNSHIRSDWALKSIGRTGCYAKPPTCHPLPDKRRSTGDNLVGNSWHFNGHWERVRDILLDVFGGWPVIE